MGGKHERNRHPLGTCTSRACSQSDTELPSDKNLGANCGAGEKHHSHCRGKGYSNSTVREFPFHQCENLQCKGYCLQRTDQEPSYSLLCQSGPVEMRQAGYDGASGISWQSASRSRQGRGRWDAYTPGVGKVWKGPCRPVLLISRHRIGRCPVLQEN